MASFEADPSDDDDERYPDDDDEGDATASAGAPKPSVWSSLEAADSDEDPDEAPPARGGGGGGDGAGGGGGGGGSATTSSSGEWKLHRDRLLLSKLLELEQPVITDKMIDFLLQDGVCETFVSFVTQLVPHDHDVAPCRPGLGFDRKPTAELQRSYRATLLLASDEPTDALLTFLGKKASVITTALFEARARARARSSPQHLSNQPTTTARCHHRLKGAGRGGTTRCPDPPERPPSPLRLTALRPDAPLPPPPAGPFRRSPAEAPRSAPASPRRGLSSPHLSVARVALSRAPRSPRRRSDPRAPAPLAGGARALLPRPPQVFLPRSCGSFHHACRILDHLLRFHADQVFDTLSETWRSAKKYVMLMLACVDSPPVAETFVKVIPLTVTVAITLARWCGVPRRVRVRRRRARALCQRAGEPSSIVDQKYPSRAAARALVAFGRRDTAPPT